MLKFILLVVVLGYLGVTAAAYLLSDRLIFLPPASSYAPGELPIVRVPVDDEHRIAVLYLPSDTATFTVLYSHGNAEDLGHVAPLLARIREEAGVSVLGFDYRGYGLSSGGPPGAKAARRDIETVYRYATGELGLPPGRIIVHGRSVGTGAALHLAARAPVGGVVVESGFVSAYRVMTGITLLPFDPFPNLANLRRVRAPVLVIHGVRDEVIRFSHGQRLFAAAPEPKRRLWVEQAGHNDLVPTAGNDYWEALADFIRMLEAEAGS